MNTSARIARHLRSNVIAYVALFVALSGTAIALPGKSKVKSNDIARSAVKGKAIAPNSVATEKVRDGAINSAKLANGSVINSKIGDGVITSAKLADDSVVRAKIGQGEVNGGKLANGSVNSSKVNDGSLLAEDFAAGQLSAGFAIDDSQTLAVELARPGRLFVTATVISDCVTDPPCTYVVEADDTAVAGTAVTGDLDEQVALAGVTGPLAAGPHTIEIVTDAAPTEPSIAAILTE